jgi:hypothetical protein
MQSTKSKPPSARLAVTSPESNTALAFMKRFCISWTEMQRNAEA